MTTSITTQAYKIWHRQLTPAQRLEIMNKVKSYKKMSLKYKACLQYIESNIDQFVN